MGVEHLVCLIFFTTSHFFSSEANNRHMICKEVESVFDEQVGGSRHPMRPPPSLPGKKGPVGPPGAKGDPGEPGDVDYAILNKTIEDLVIAKVGMELKGIFEILNEFNASLHKVEDEKENIKVCPRDGAVTYKGKCYWFVLKSTNSVNFAQGRELCSEDGGELADVLDQTHYNLIETKFRELWPKNTNWFWIGLTYNPSTKVARDSSGSTTTFLKWFGTIYPSSGSSNNKMCIEITKNPSSSHGMYNTRSTSKTHGSLCQA